MIDCDDIKSGEKELEDVIPYPVESLPEPYWDIDKEDWIFMDSYE